MSPERSSNSGRSGFSGRSVFSGFSIFSILAPLVRLPAAIPVALALLGFWVLSRGMTAGPGAITGYAEEYVHAVGPLQAGRLLEVRVQLGQPVRAGDVVAVLDPRPLQLQRERLVAEKERAQAELRAEQDLQSAQLQRSQLQAVRSHATEERGRAELRELEQQVKRLEGLHAEHLVRASELEAVRQRQRAVAADLEARTLGTTKELEQMGLRPRGRDEQAQRLEERLAPFRAALRVHEAQLRELDHTLGELTLRAPVDGTVGAVLRRPGDVLGAGTEVLHIITMRPGHVVAFVPERKQGGLTPGAVVQLRRIGTVFGTLRGHVQELAPMIEEVPPRARPSPTVPLWARRVVIRLDEPAQLLPGEAFRVSAR